MTSVDAMAIVAGVALSFSCRPIVGGFPYVVPPAWVLAVIVVAWIFWVGASATSASVAARLVRYRRGPRPAEWVAILSTLGGLILMNPSRPIDLLARWLPSGMVGGLDTFASWRWAGAGLASAIIAATFGLLRLGRGFVPPWARSAVLAFLAFLAISGPFATIHLEGANLFAPPMGFGPGNRPMFYWLTCQWVAAIPLGLMAGVPAVAAVLERLQGRPWRWTEWAGALSSSMILLSLSPLFQGNFPGPSTWWAAERAMAAAWLLVVGMLSFLLAVRLGPSWSRWLGDQVPESGSRPIDASPARTL